MNQKQKVIRHLEKFGSITPLEAMNDYSIMRLTSRICELKDEGYVIKSELVSGVNKFKEKVTFSKYTLLNEEVEARYEDEEFDEEVAKVEEKRDRLANAEEKENS